MTEKTQTQVVIDGKVLTMSGYESIEYLQMVAAYINNKISELKKIDSFRHANPETRNRMTELNIADDYFKAKKQIEFLENSIKDKEEELYNIKHDIVKKEVEVEKTKEALRKIEEEKKEYEKKIFRLESELRAESKFDPKSDSKKTSKL